MLPPKKAQFSLVEEIGHLQLVILFLGVGSKFSNFLPWPFHGLFAFLGSFSMQLTDEQTM